MSKVLEARNITKIYNHYQKNEFIALHNISLEIESGDFICIMGPSGSGKSTLLNNLSTIDFPTSGNVYIKGKNVMTMNEFELGQFRYQNLGFIFQNYNLLNTLTLFNNIAIPMTLANEKQDEINERVLEVAKQLGIEVLLEKYPNECSGGQCQRAAIARALVAKPNLIVADEPTGNLDSTNSHQILTILKQLNEEHNVTVMIVTHDAMIASYAKKLLYIIDGKIDAILEKGNKNQTDYYNEIVALNSKEALDLIK